MSVTLVHQKVKEESVEEAKAAVRDWFQALDRARPGGLRYASTRVPDSAMFVILTELADDIEDPRKSMPEFHRFLERLKAIVDGPPVIERLDVVGSYHLFDQRPPQASAG